MWKKQIENMPLIVDGLDSILIGLFCLSDTVRPSTDSFFYSAS